MSFEDFFFGIFHVVELCRFFFFKRIISGVYLFCVINSSYSFQSRTFETLHNVFKHIKVVHEVVLCHLKIFFLYFPRWGTLSFFFCKKCQRRVPILCNQHLLQLLTQIFETLQNIFGHIKDMQEAV